MISLNNSTIKQMPVYIHCTHNNVAMLVYAVTQFTKAFFTLKMSYAFTEGEEGRAFPESSFTRLINAQQYYVHISYPVAPKSDNKYEKYGYKLIYASK
jgi:hypothetical protein